VTTAAVVVLVVGLLLVAAIAGGALVAQRRRDQRPSADPRPRPAAPAARRREEPLTDPITTRTAQADPPTVKQPNPLFGEGEQHPTPPPHGGNGRAP
jgi:hypothetical protein